MTDSDRVSDGCLVAMLRCETCKYWDANPEVEGGADGYGACGHVTDSPAHDKVCLSVGCSCCCGYGPELLTKPDFGCVLWRGK